VRDVGVVVCLRSDGGGSTAAVVVAWGEYAVVRCVGTGQRGAGSTAAALVIGGAGGCVQRQAVAWQQACRGTCAGDDEDSRTGAGAGGDVAACGRGTCAGCGTGARGKGAAGGCVVRADAGWCNAPVVQPVGEQEGLHRADDAPSAGAAETGRGVDRLLVAGAGQPARVHAATSKGYGRSEQ